MKKQILCILVMLVMVIVIMPCTAFAETASYGTFTDGSRVISDVIRESGQYAHPRIIMTDEKFLNLKSHIDDGSVTAILLQELRSEADRIVRETTPSEYDAYGDDHLLETSKRIQRHVAALALAYNIFGDKKYADHCYEELKAACSFPDWSPKHFLDTAEMCTAFAYGYDWLYNWMTPEQRTLLRTNMIEKGLSQVMQDYTDTPADRTRTYKWYQDQEGDNWQLVCTGGTNLAALAIGDEDDAKDISAKVLSYGYKRAYSFVRRSYSVTDGTYIEGLGYWDYATYYLGLQSSALKSAAGTDYGLADYEGIRKSAEFVRYMSSNTPTSFSFGDDRDSRDTGWAVFLWLGEQLNSPELSAVRLKKIDSDPEFNYLDVLWIDESKQTGTETDRNTDWGAVGASNASFRDSWNKSGLVAALHVGENNYKYHGHYDLGSFYVESNGARFFTDLGNENYKLEDRQYSYRIKAEGHNTLVINPTDGIDQREGANCLITAFRSGNEAYAVTDLTDAYTPSGAANVIRGLKMIKDKGCVIVQDEISLKAPGEIYWFAHTKGQIKLASDKKSAVVTVGSDKMWVGIIGDNGKFSVMNAKPLPTSLSISGQTDNKEYRKLAIHLTNTKDTTISVACIKLKYGETKPSWTPSVKAISDWASQSSGNETTPVSISGAAISSIADQTYTGSAVTPDITVKDGSKTLIKNTDYTLSYNNNINAGTATVTATGKGNYTGTKTATFNIVARNISNAAISSIANQTYTGSAVAPAVTVKDGSRTLVSGTDYTVSYSSNINVGNVTVTVTGKGNYKGTKTAAFAIVTRNISNAAISSIANQTYTGSAVAPAVTVKDGSKTLTKNTDYTISYSNNTNVGTAKVTITGKNNYTGTKTATFNIVANDFTVSSIGNQTYTGSAVTPDITVKDGSRTLTSGTDYTVSYSNNTNIGTAKVTITGKGKYTGTKTVTFKIVAKNISGSTISSIADQTYTGSALTPDVTVKEGSRTLTSGTDYTVSYSNNINAGSATVTVTGKGNYTGTRTATFAIVAPSKQITGIAVVAPRPVPKFYTGDNFDPTGYSLKITYDDRSTETIPLTSGMVSGYDKTRSGSQKLTATYKGKTASFSVSVTALTVTSIAVKSQPKTAYFLYDEIDLSAGKFEVTYNSGKTETVPMTADGVTYKGFDSTKTGTNNVVLTYLKKTVSINMYVTVDPNNAPVTIGKMGFESLASAAAHINDKINAKTASESYTISVNTNIVEAKAVTFPKVNITLSVNRSTVITVPSVTANGDLTISDLTFVTAKAAPAPVTAKAALTASDCVLGKTTVTGHAKINNCTINGDLTLNEKDTKTIVTSTEMSSVTVNGRLTCNNALTLTDCNVSGALTAKADLTISGGKYDDSVTVSSVKGTTKINGTATIAKDLSVSNDLAINGKSTIGGKFTAKGALSINGFTVKNGK